MDCYLIHRIGFASTLFLVTLICRAEPFDPAQQPPAYSAPVVLSDSGLGDATLLFQTWFDAAAWRGDLLAYALDAGTGKPKALRWSAAQQLTTRDWTTRLIVTRRDDNGENIILGRLSDLSTIQQQALGDQATLDYLRGDPSEEGLRFRPRRHLDRDGDTARDGLGPIIHSNPIYIDIPPARLYVGANDGMLHVFAASDGHEMFAYAPGMLLPQLAKLSTNIGMSPPLYSVDGGLTTGTVRFRDGTTHTLLVGALGAGGQGVFALDITNPDVQTEAQALDSVLWEFSDHDDAALGYSYATPQLAQLDDGRWVVIIGNGYDNTSDDSHAGSGSAQLLVIDAEQGRLIRRLDTYSGAATDPNGLSTPRAIDANGDGRVDFVYAGDLFGQMWRFDLRGASDAWRVSCGGAPLFTASDPLNHPQAISVAPAIAADAQQGVRVLFGTGRLLANSDLDALGGAQIQSLYGVWDRLNDTCRVSMTTLRQTLNEGSYGDGQRVRYSSQNTLANNEFCELICLPAKGSLPIRSSAANDSSSLRRSPWLLEAKYGC